MNVSVFRGTLIERKKLKTLFCKLNAMDVPVFKNKKDRNEVPSIVKHTRISSSIPRNLSRLLTDIIRNLENLS